MSEIKFAKYIYIVHADVNNEGRKVIFTSKDWNKAKLLMNKINKSDELAGSYANAKMERKLQGYE